VTREYEVQVGGRCVGYVVQSSRGYVARDGKNAQVGTYATVERAIAAVAGQRPDGDPGPKFGPKLADTADNK